MLDFSVILPILSIFPNFGFSLGKIWKSLKDIILLENYFFTHEFSRLGYSKT